MDFIKNITDFIKIIISSYYNFILEAVSNNQFAATAVMVGTTGLFGYLFNKSLPALINIIQNQFLFTFEIKAISRSNGFQSNSDESIFANNIKNEAYKNNLFKAKRATINVVKLKATQSIVTGKIFTKLNGVFCIMTYQLNSSKDNDSGTFEYSILNIKCSHKNKMKMIEFFDSCIHNSKPSVYANSGDGTYNTPDFNKIREVGIPIYFKFNTKIKEYLDNAIDTFLSERESYEINKKPYRLSIMLYGPPGTGKTTIAEYIAARMKTNLFYNKGIKSKMLIDSIKRISEITPDNKTPVLLFDDVDIYYENICKNDDSNISESKHKIMEQNLDRANFLTLLDSSISPDNIVYVFTTNNYDKLDPAIRRSGRFNIALKIDALGEDVIKDIYFERFGDEIPNHIDLSKTLACELDDVFKTIRSLKTVDSGQMFNSDLQQTLVIDSVAPKQINTKSKLISADISD